MARHEQDREDLIAEATALRTRVELTVPSREAPLVIGRRDNGWLSVYFGADPVYHFDESGGLRRAFVNGALYRSEQQTLSRLARHRPDAATSDLLRHDLSPDELREFLDAMNGNLAELCRAVDEGTAVLLRQVSPAADPLPELRGALEGARTGRLARKLRPR